MNGIVVINKPKGKTSHNMVSFMRALTGIKKIGHTGTLDPMAEGVLPVCIGNATKAADMLTLSDKRYRAVMALGKTTDTLDAEGEVTGEFEVNVTEEEIIEAVKSFEGEIFQIPPMYSAIKQQGKKLYELARAGVEVTREPRRVFIKSIDVLEIKENTVTIDVECSKGTYIRTLCDDIGKKLNTGAYMTELVRTKTGPFTIDNALTPDEVRARYEEGKLEVIPTDSLFSQLEALHLNEKQTRSIKNGVRMTWRGAKEGQSCRLYGSDGEFLCISDIVEGRLVLRKSFWS
ncbi:MAG: tRNA pseudouridine(55) synthase TruB [Clostridiales bacterium]|nr:tRNA pseudouridine(55) synthase TruB [Clostridiales bacterium]